ncbi:hypothetical protein QUF90_17080 [Desulfococcaceae bacterium HSG9]|nr:hypothetical protein [Desulfococcaceae bacterium HSG9]
MNRLGQIVQYQMQTIINHIYQISHLAYRTNDFLLFGIDEYTLLVYFEGKISRKTDIENEDRYQELELTDLKSFNLQKIKRILIAYGQNLSTRNIDEIGPQHSVSYRLFSFLQKIIALDNSEASQAACFDARGQKAKRSNAGPGKKCGLYDIVMRHELTLNDGYDDPDSSCAIYCDIPQNYVFEIDIQKKYFQDSLFINRLADQFLIDDHSGIPSIYEHYYRKKPAVGDAKELKILGTDTKIRRIGYLKLLADFLKKYKNVPKAVLNKKFESFASPFESELNRYKNTTGVIRSAKTGISAKSYINLARKSGLILYLNGVYSAGKQFKVYIQLKEQLSDEKTFNLSLFDKLFFGEHLLRHDFFYLTSLLELIFIFGPEPTSYDQMKRCFHPYILKKLEEIKKQKYGFYQLSKQEADRIRAKYQKMKESPPDGSDIVAYQLTRKETGEINKIYQRIQDWKKAHVYLEHILMPRLNWLLDLDFIKLDKKLKITLTSEGLRFFHHINAWHDMICERVVSPDAFLDRFSSQLFSDVYQMPNKRFDSIQDKTAAKTIGYINESFEHFRTLAPNRVTASQAIYYTKYNLYFRDKTDAEYTDIMEFLQSYKHKRFLTKIQKRQKDGYIQKIR